MKYNFDKIIDRRGTGCVKYDILKEHFGREDAIPMFVADMDFEVAPFITDAITERAAHHIYGYGIRDDKWYDSIIGWVERRNGWSIERDWIDFVPGVITGYVFALRALTNEDDGILINPPVYHPFAGQIKANDRKVVNSPMVLRNGKYEFDFDNLDKKLSEASALLFCNPHNPTGRVFTREELERVGELCCRHNVWIISDEIHSDLVRKPAKHIHIASLRPEFAERTVTLISPSKTFNLAGLSSSVIITPNDSVRRRIRREAERYDVAQGNVFGTAALKAAYTYGDEWLDQLNEYIEGNIRFVEEYIRDIMPTIKVSHAEGTYIMWLDCRELGMEQEKLHRFFIDDAGVALSDGKIFGTEGEGFVRMVTAMPKAIIEQALKQIANAYNKLPINK